MLARYFASENGILDPMETCVSSSGTSTSDQLTNMERSKSEVSAMSEEPPDEEGVAKKEEIKEEIEEREEEREEEEEEEEDEEDETKWGPLKKPVTVKIADLGNACWVVSGRMFLVQDTLWKYPD